MLADLLGRFTYAGIFAVLLASGFGAPIPEEVPIALAGALARHGHVIGGLAFPVCLAGILAGDAILYLAGRRWGARALECGPIRRVLSPERAARFLRMYRRYGLAVVAVARLLVGLRGAAFVTAGVARLPFLPFIAVDAAAALVTGAITFGLGYALAGHVDLLIAGIESAHGWAGVSVGLALAVAAACTVALRWRRQRG